MNEINKGLLRHLLTIAGGVLVHKGVLTSEDLSTVIGSLLTIIGVGWSVFAKKKTS
jgi:hypothetical protein